VNRLYPNQTEALLAAQQRTRERGFSDEVAARDAAAFPVEGGWEAWYVVHIKPLWRSPIQRKGDDE
jgi:hypothetical protein